MLEIVINGKHYEVRQFAGKVMQANKHLETKVSGGGGGGLTYQGTGGSAAVNISSTTVTHDDVYLQNEQGREYVLRLRNWDVACRDGHEMQAVWLSRDGTETDYVLIRNRTTDSVQWAHRPFAKMFRLSEPGCFWIGLSVLLAVSLMGASIWLGLVSLALPVWIWMRNKKGRQGIADTRREILALLDRAVAPQS
jgi:hypothetical protein